MSKTTFLFILILSTLCEGQYYKEPTCRSSSFLHKQFASVVETKDGNEHSVYLYSCIEGDNVYAANFDQSNIVTEWVKQTGNISYFNDDGKEIPLKDGYQLSLYMYDCEKRRSKPIVGIVYDSKGAVKMSVESEHYQIDWASVIPDSVGESLLEYACNRLN